MRKSHSLSLALCLLGFVLCAVSGMPRTLAESFVADVRLGPASQNKTTIYADSDSVTFTQTVETSADVPNTATAYCHSKGRFSRLRQSRQCPLFCFQPNADSATCWRPSIY
jgi:putative hemolysin